MKYLITLLLAGACSFAFGTPSPEEALRKSDRRYFTENKGQWPEQVLFQARLNGLDAWITKTGVVYDFYRLKERPAVQESGLSAHGKFQRGKSDRSGQVVRVTLANANPSPLPQGESKQAGVSNYFIGSDRSKWATDVRLYKDAWVRSACSGVDLHYYFDEGQLRYDYVLAAGADASRIGMDFQGMDGRPKVNAAGELELGTRFGTVKQAKLFAYQIVNGNKKQVGCRFSPGKDGNVRFALGAYDKALPLVIDPLVYSATLSTTNSTFGRAVRVDAAGNAYVTGVASSADFPTTPGSYDRTLSGDDEAFVTKFNAAGSGLVFSTFLGGSNYEQPRALRIDGSGNVYVSGETGSTDFPTLATAYDRTFNGGDYDVFLAKLGPASNTLLYGTYLGGSDDDYAPGLDLDAAGNAYVAGNTESSDFPTTAGAFDRSFSGFNDGFIAKIDASGAGGLSYSTLLGGSDQDEVRAIRVDASGYANVAGVTYSANFPTFLFSLSQTLGGLADAFAAKLQADGSGLLYSTYLGGSAFDEGTALDVDAQGNAYVAGGTQSANFPSAGGANSPANNGGNDVFVAKIDAYGIDVTYSTLIGGTDYDLPTGLRIDTLGNAYVAGYTRSSDFPVVAGSYSQASGGFIDGFAARLSTAGGIAYSTNIGGSDFDQVIGMDTDPQGNTYVTGYTQSPDFPTTAGSYSQAHSTDGDADCFVSKLPRFVCPPIGIALGANTPLCAGDTLKLTATVTGAGSYHWAGPNGFSDTGRNPRIPRATIAAAGTYTFVAANGNGCADSAIISVTVHARPVVAVGSNGPVCAGDTLKLTGAPNGAVRYAWTGPNGFTSSAQNPRIDSPATDASGTYVLAVTDGNGCTDSDAANVTVNALPAPPQPYEQYLPCEGGVLTFSTPNVYWDYGWTGPNGFSSTMRTPSIVNATLAASGTYVLTVSGANGCRNSGSVTVTVHPLPPVPTPTSNSPVCSGHDLLLYSNPGYAHYDWTRPGVYLDSTQNLVFPNATAGMAGMYTLTVYDTNGCRNEASVSVAVNPSPSVVVTRRNNVLTAQQSGATYQWLRCSGGAKTEIAGALNQDYAVTAAGDYAVAVDLNGCRDTSACQSFMPLEVRDVAAAAGWSVWPNPSHGVFTIASDVPSSFELLDVTGRRLGTYEVKGASLDVHASLPAGVYLLRRQGTGEVRKVVVE